jgi:hypothetical protein
MIWILIVEFITRLSRILNRFSTTPAFPVCHCHPWRTRNPESLFTFLPDKRTKPGPGFFSLHKRRSLRGENIIYIKCIHFIMSSTSVYSIRIDTRVRKMIDEIPDRTLQEEIRSLIEQAVKRKRKEQLLAQARERQHRLPGGIPAAQSVREDRDAR